MPIVESTINDVLFASVAVFFLWALPERLERRTLLDLLHRLRSLAHVVDMHQLDKDPEQARPDYHPTSVSPERRIMNAEELHHYFDYCSELVSLIAKTAALCAERTSDPVVLGTVSEIETLAAQMSPRSGRRSRCSPSTDRGAQRPSTSRSPGSRAGSFSGSASTAQSERFHSGTGVRQSSRGTNRERCTSS